MAGQSDEYRTMEKNVTGANDSANKKEEVALGGTHTAKVSLQCDTPGAGAEPPRKEEERAHKTDLDDVMTCSSDEGLRFLCDVALPVSASISSWVGGVDVLEAVLSFGRGLVFSGCVAGVVFTEVNFWSRVLSLLLATGFWLMTVSVVVFAVVCI